MHDLLLFIISLIFLFAYILIFFSDVFISSVFAQFPALARPSENDPYVYEPTLFGNIIIAAIIVLLYALVYLLLLNLR